MLGFNVLEKIQIAGKGIMDIEDFLVSNVLLPLGSLVYVLFCSRKYGWGWKNYIGEVNCGEKGAKMPGWIRPYFTYILPIIVIIVFIMSVVG